MEDIVLNFEDFLNPFKGKKVEGHKAVELSKIEEDTLTQIQKIEPKIEEDILDLGQKIEPKIETKIEEDILDLSQKIQESHIDTPIILERETIEDSKYYTLYKDISEEFSCDVDIEGSREEAIARLIIETPDWTLLFPGTILDGRCNIPIKKLNIFNEGQKGIIKLEVIVEGTVFTPWEDEFKIKLSKKVNVSFNENKKSPFKPQKSPEIGVKVTMK